MEKGTTKETKKQHQDISRLLGCLTKVNVIKGENGLKTTQNVSCAYQRKPVITYTA